jgi:hypothetical protein
VIAVITLISFCREIFFCFWLLHIMQPPQQAGELMTQSIKLRAVLEGDHMMVAVEGGFIRRTVAEDGVVVATDIEEFFLPESKVREALAALDAARDVTVPAKRPKHAAQLDLMSSRSTDKKQGSGS